MSKIVLKFSSVTAISFAMGTGLVAAQDGEDFFARDRYEAVTDRAQPEFDPLPIRSGGFEIRSEAGFSAGATSNLFAANTNEIDDIFFGFSPTVDVDSTWSRNAFGLRGRLDHREYSDTTSESRTNIDVGADARLDISNAVSFYGAVQAADLVEPRSSIASIQGASEPVEYSQIGGELGAQYQAGRIRLQGALGLETFDYDDVELANGLIQDQDFRDRDSTSFVGQAAYAIERDWAVFAEVEVEEFDYNEPGVFNVLNRDYSSTAVRVGTDFELQSLLRGEIGVGAFQSEYDDPLFEDVDGVSVDGTVQWFVTQLSTVSLGVGRGVIDPGIVLTNSAVQSNANARIDHEFRRNLVLTGEARFTNFDFENVDRNDDRWNLRTAAVWKINPNLWIDGAYELTDQSSNVQSFTENRFTIGLRIFP